MVVLITGASHTGKTLLAQRLLEKYKYPCFSIDHLKMGLIRSGQTTLTPLDDEALTHYLWPVVREIIKTAVENRQHLIVEGGYVPFTWRQDLGAEYLRAIRFFCLAFTDKYIETHFDEIKRHACDIEYRLDDAGCTVNSLKADNRRCREGFQAAGEHVVLIDGNYEQAVETLLYKGIESLPA